MPESINSIPNNSPSVVLQQIQSTSSTRNPSQLPSGGNSSSLRSDSVEISAEARAQLQSSSVSATLSNANSNQDTSSSSESTFSDLANRIQNINQLSQVVQTRQNVFDNSSTPLDLTTTSSTNSLPNSIQIDQQANLVRAQLDQETNLP